MATSLGTNGGVVTRVYCICFTCPASRDPVYTLDTSSENTHFVYNSVFYFCNQYNSIAQINELFSSLSQKMDIDISCQLSSMETIGMKCQRLVSEKK